MKRRDVRHKREQQKSINTKKFFFLVIVTIFGACVLFTVSFLLIAGLAIFSMHTQSLGGNSLEWHRDKNINLVTGYIASNGTLSSVGILSVDKDTARLVPLSDTASLAQGGSTMQLKAAYALEKLQGKEDAIDNFLKMIDDNTQIYIDGYVFVREGAKENTIVNVSPSSFSVASIGFPGFLFKANQIHGFLGNDIYTNLSLSSLWTLSNILSGQLKPTLLMMNAKDIDNGVLDPESFSQDIGSQLVDTYLHQEHARISILNGSGKAGEADFLAGLLQNEGGLIDYVGDTSPSTHTMIYVQSPNNFPATIERLKRMTHGQVVQRQYSITSDISVVIGDDIVDIL